MTQREKIKALFSNPDLTPEDLNYSLSHEINSLITENAFLLGELMGTLSKLGTDDANERFEQLKELAIKKGYL